MKSFFKAKVKCKIECTEQVSKSLKSNFNDRGVKYLSHFTWLLYLSIILEDFYFIRYNLNRLLVLLLDYISEEKTVLFTYNFISSESTLHFYLILCTLNMVNWISKVHAWRENQCSSSTLLQLWLSSGKYQISKESNLRKQSCVFPPKKFWKIFWVISCVIHWMRANKIKNNWVIYIQDSWWIELSKDRHLSEIKSVCNIIHYAIQKFRVSIIIIIFGK